MENLSLQHADISQPVHILHVLCAVFEKMAHREGLVDALLQRKATVATDACIREYNEALNLFNEREKSRPSAPRTVHKVFGMDLAIKDRAGQKRILSRPRCNPNMAIVLSRLFSEEENTAGALEKCWKLEEENYTRFSLEL